MAIQTAMSWVRLIASAMLVCLASSAYGQPNPYRLVENWAQLPKDMNGGKWGEVIGVKPGPDGSIWVLHRCFNVMPEGSATCVGRDNIPPIMKFDTSGRLLESFGQGVFAFPHGFHIDHDGNIWATDANRHQTVLGLPANGRGHQVFKFDPHGKVLMTLGRAGVAGKGQDTFDQPTDVVVGRDGAVFVSDGHGSNNRIVKFSRDGRYLKEWGKTGSGPGEFDQPHALDIDPQGRIFVADRSNNRLQIFDQEGNYLDQWKQFGRPSGHFIAPDGTILVTDSQSNAKRNPGFRRGISIGNIRDAVVTAFIPDPDSERQESTTITGASGIMIDPTGSIYAADVEPHTVRKYVKR
jgi:DNA-binding beta-propeller fold protein YncE